MPYEKITYEKKDRIAYLTLNRPHVLNAWDHSMAQETEDALDAFDQDDVAWVLIISGFGRAFCSGGDVNMFKAQMEGRHPSGTGRRQDTILCELKNWKPVIAAVHGYAYGMGLIISAEADMIIAADNTQFAISELKRSLGGVGVWARVSQWMPSKVAAEMAITGDPITAQDAYRLGLVNRVVPLDQLMSRGRKDGRAHPFSASPGLPRCRAGPPGWQLRRLCRRLPGARLLLTSRIQRTIGRP